MDAGKYVNAAEAARLIAIQINEAAARLSPDGARETTCTIATIAHGLVLGAASSVTGIPLERLLDVAAQGTKEAAELVRRHTSGRVGRA